MSNINQFISEFKKIEWALFRFEPDPVYNQIIRFINPIETNKCITYSEPDSFITFEPAFYSAIENDLDGLLSREALEFFSLITIKTKLIENPNLTNSYKPHIENLTKIITTTPDHKERIKLVLLKPNYIIPFRDAFGVLLSQDMGFLEYDVNIDSPI